MRDVLFAFFFSLLLFVSFFLLRDIFSQICLHLTPLNFVACDCSVSPYPMANSQL